MKLILSVVLLGLVAAATGQLDTEAQRTTACSSSWTNYNHHHIADPTSCQSYYNCDDDYNIFAQFCPPTTLFDLASGLCLTNLSIGCDIYKRDLCFINNLYSPSVGNVLRTRNYPSLCACDYFQYTCPQSQNGRGFWSNLRCPDGQVFNPNSRICQNDNSGTSCGDRAFCSVAGPSNCLTYKSIAGQPCKFTRTDDPTNSNFTCAPGTYFSATDGCICARASEDGFNPSCASTALPCQNANLVSGSSSGSRVSFSGTSLNMWSFDGNDVYHKTTSVTINLVISSYSSLSNGKYVFFSNKPSGSCSGTGLAVEASFTKNSNSMEVRYEVTPYGGTSALTSSAAFSTLSSVNAGTVRLELRLDFIKGDNDYSIGGTASAYNNAGGNLLRLQPISPTVINTGSIDLEVDANRQLLTCTPFLIGYVSGPSAFSGSVSAALDKC